MTQVSSALWLAFACCWTLLALAAVAEPAVVFDGENYLDVAEPPDHKYNVKAYGAVGDGQHNDTDAFRKALKAASEAVNYSSVWIPEGRYLIWPVLIEDCMNTWIEIEGTIMAPQEPEQWPQNEYYFHFVSPSNCSIVGVSGSSAEIRGNGMGWWSRPAEEGTAPTLLLYSGTFESYPQPGVYNISMFDAPSSHVRVLGSRMYSGPEVSGVKMVSTDTGRSSGIVVTNASLFVEKVDIDVGGVHVTIETGYGDNNYGFMRIDQSTFRRGEGVTILMTDGLMGNISLSNLDFYSTSYGIRALGARDGNGELIGVFCDDLYMNEVGTPFYVSNDVCPKSHKGCTRSAKGVSVTMINIDRVSGTQTTGNAGAFMCTTAKPCSIGLSNVDIRPMSPSTENTFRCQNAEGYTDETVSPKSCLKPRAYSKQLIGF